MFSLLRKCHSCESCVAPSVLHPSPLALMLGQCLQWAGHTVSSARRRFQWVFSHVLAMPWISHGSFLGIAFSVSWLSGIAYSGDWREVWPIGQLLAVPRSVWVIAKKAVGSNAVLLPWLVGSQCWEHTSPLHPKPVFCLQQRGAVLLSTQRCWPCQAPEPPALPRPFSASPGNILHPNCKESFVQCFSII